MISISEFFKRIGGIQAKEIAFRNSIRSAIKEFVNIEVPMESITYKSGVISLKNILHSARSAIFIKKGDIIKRANILQTTRHITDIR